MGKAGAGVNRDGRIAGATIGTVGGWHRRIVALALPIVLANLSVPMLSAVDTAVAGHLDGQASLGGVAQGGLIFNAMIWGLAFLRMATTGLVAQAIGAGEPATARLELLRALVLAGLLGSVILVFQRPLIGGGLALLGGSAEVEAAARAYCDARIWSAPATLANNVVLGYLLGSQRTKLGFGLQLALNVINMVLANGLVYGLGYGVEGIGAATALADVAGLLLGLALLWRLRPRELPPLDWRAVWARGPLLRLFAINRDIFLRTACLLAASGVFARLGAGLGDVVLAGNAVLLNFQTFTAFGLDGFAYAAEALVGLSTGARDRASLRSVSRAAMLWAGICSVGFSLLYFALGPLMVQGLTDQPVVREQALADLPWAIVLPMVSVWGFVYDGIFIGATRATELRNGMVVSLGIFLASAFTLMPIAGNNGLWAALTLFMAMRGVCLAWYFPRIGADWPPPAFVD